MRKLLLLLISLSSFLFLFLLPGHAQAACSMSFNPGLPLRNLQPNVSITISDINPNGDLSDGSYILQTMYEIHAGPIGDIFSPALPLDSDTVNITGNSPFTFDTGPFASGTTGSETYIWFKLIDPHGGDISSSCQELSTKRQISKEQYVAPENGVCNSVDVLTGLLVPNGGIWYRITPGGNLNRGNNGVVLKKWENGGYNRDLVNTCVSDLAMRNANIPVTDSNDNTHWPTGKYSLTIGGCNSQGTFEPPQICPTLTNINIDPDGGSIGPGEGEEADSKFSQPLSLPCQGEENCAEIQTALGGISTSPEGFVTKLMAIILSLSGGIVLFLIIASGYKLMTSQGDPEKVKEAKERLTAAIVGLLFIIFSLVILEAITVDILQIPGFSK